MRKGRILSIVLLSILLLGNVNIISLKTSNSALVKAFEVESYLTIENCIARVEISLNPFGFQLVSKDTGLITKTYNFNSDNSFVYTRNLRKHTLKEFENYEEVPNGIILNYKTTDRNDAEISIIFITSNTVKMSFSLEKTKGVFSVNQDIELFDEEAIYGLTERISPNKRFSEVYPKEIGSLDRRGAIHTMVVLPTVGVYTPFYHSSNGYGLYVNTTSFGYFDTGCIVKDRLRFGFIPSEDTNTVLEYYLFLGPSHDKILDEYTNLTGRPFVPPEWSFYHWRWRDVHEETTAELDGNTINGQVAEDILKYEELGIPVGNYWIDRPWTPGKNGFAEFAWNPEQFPNAYEMIQSLTDRGYHLAVWGSPFAWGWKKGQNGYEAVLNRYYTKGDIKHIDFTNPEAYEWWKNKIEDFVLENNIHGWKLDRGDEDQPSLWWNKYWNGLSGIQMRNLYPVLYQKCYYDAMQEAWGDDFVNIARSGWSGSQQYAVIWAGDTRGSVERNRLVSTDLGLRSVILSQLHCSFMGFPIWGSDTGGFIEFRDREVFARWLQFSAFSPLMEIGGRGSHAPWDMPTEPNYDEEMIDIYRTYVQLHHDLVDYIYENALESGESGRAIARPLIFDYPDDLNVKDMWDEYMFGPDILVAPVWKSGQRERVVYIPSGEFVDYWNPNTTYSGPITINVNTPLDKMPVFIKKGSELLGREW